MFLEPYSFRCFLVVTALLAGALSAQKTWVVDANGGPGYDFRDLPGAVVAVANGDTVVVRAGTYSTFSTAKSLMMLEC